MELRLRARAEEFDLGAGSELVAELYLEIGRRRGIRALGLLAAEEAAVGAVTDTYEIAEFIIWGCAFEVEALFEKAEISRTTESYVLWLTVLDIQCGGYLVAIAGLEAAGVEIHAAGELRVDDTESFLLGVVDEIGAEDFEIIDVGEILIVVAAADGVLGGKFVVGADEDFEQAFDAANGGGDIDGVLRVDLYETGFLPIPLILYDDLLKRLAAVFQAHDDMFFFVLAEEKIALFGFMAGIGKDEGKGFFGGDFYVEGAGVGGGEAGGVAEDGYGDAWEGIFILVEDPAGDRGSMLPGRRPIFSSHLFLGKRRDSQGEKDQDNDDSQVNFVYVGRRTIRRCF